MLLDPESKMIQHCPRWADETFSFYDRDLSPFMIETLRLERKNIAHLTSENYLKSEPELTRTQTFSCTIWTLNKTWWFSVSYTLAFYTLTFLSGPEPWSISLYDTFHLPFFLWFPVASIHCETHIISFLPILIHFTPSHCMSLQGLPWKSTTNWVVWTTETHGLTVLEPGVQDQDIKRIAPFWRLWRMFLVSLHGS